jgi:hypothetical protein
VDEARVVSKCAGCNAEASNPKDLKHADDCKKKALTRGCKHVL